MDAFRKPREKLPPRMRPLARLPLFFKLDGKRAVVAGDDAAAAWKTELLSAAGAAVDVYAADACPELRHLKDDQPGGRITIHCRDWTPDDLDNATIAIGSFKDDPSAAAFAAASRARGIPVNVVDRPAFCDFAFGSIVNRSPLVIGISTDGAAPVFAQMIRAKLEAFIPKGFANWAAAAARWREHVKASGLSFVARRRVWQIFTEHAVANPDTLPEIDNIQNFISEVRGGLSSPEVGTVTLVGAGPGDPELLTLRALRALQSADVILFDDLVSREILDFARREAKKMLVGKTAYGPSCRQSDINALMANLARKGKRVVRLKGGDPMIFGRAGEEIAACRSADIEVEIVPGITAAQGAASTLGIPLTDRGRVRRVQYITGHGRGTTPFVEQDWASLADPATTTAIYMPTSTFSALVKEALAHGLDPNMPAVAIYRATRPDQSVVADRIVHLPDKVGRIAADGPLLVMLGRTMSGAFESSNIQNSYRVRSNQPHR